MEAKNWTKRQQANGVAIVNGDFNSDDVVAHGVSEERADMIIKACRAHDDLVKALQRIHTFAFDAPELREMARIALSTAGA